MILESKEIKKLKELCKNLNIEEIKIIINAIKSEGEKANKLGYYKTKYNIPYFLIELIALEEAETLPPKEVKPES